MTLQMQSVVPQCVLQRALQCVVLCVLQCVLQCVRGWRTGSNDTPNVIGCIVCRCEWYDITHYFTISCH